MARPLQAVGASLHVARFLLLARGQLNMHLFDNVAWMHASNKLELVE